MPDTQPNAAEVPESLPDFLQAVRNPHTLQLGIIDRTDRPHYDKFCDGIIGCLNAASALERQLAWTIASDYWRLNRLRGIEDGIFTLSHPNPTAEFGSTSIEKQIAVAQTSVFLSRQSDFKFLSQHEMRIQRMLNRNKAELKQLQAERHKLEIEPAAPPATVFKAHQQGAVITTNTERTRDTSRNGFEFSDSSAAAAKFHFEPPEGPRVPAAQLKVIPFDPTSRTGIAPNGFAFSKAAPTGTSPFRKSASLTRVG